MLSRRRFVVALASNLGLAGWTWPVSSLAASGRTNLSSAQRRWLLAVLPKEDHRYDPFARMLVTTISDGSTDYPNRRLGDVHAPRNSLAYAAALLDTGVAWRMARAREILRAVLPLQDREPESKTHGLWPWSLEEPINTLLPPDWIWADCCNMSLLMTWIGHRKTLDASLAQAVRDSLLLGAQAAQRRRVHPGDTSLAILATSVMLLVAQELKLPDLRASAKDRLRNLHDYVNQQGSFEEYNSPPRTILALQELARMLLLVKDGRDRAWITALHDLAWRQVATHFHPPSQQWAGPHSCSSDTDLRRQPATLAFLQTACDGKANLHLIDPLPLSLEAYRLPLQCPRKWVKHFVQLEAPHQVVETFVQADPGRAGWKNPVTGTTWLHPRLTVGSINRGDFWRQRRPLLAYWGSPTAPRSLRVRFLKNDSDFASALLFTAQHESAVLAVVVFATDYGDAHPKLDLVRNATIRAKDLRLRFEFGGESKEFIVGAAGEPARHLLLQDPAVRFVLQPVADSFGGTAFGWDRPELKLSARLDAVAYAGEEKELILCDLNEAFACFALDEWPYEQKQMPPANVEVQRNGGILRARWPTRGQTLALDIPVKPGPYASLNDAFRSSAGNREF